MQSDTAALQVQALPPQHPLAGPLLQAISTGGTTCTYRQVVSGAGAANMKPRKPCQAPSGSNILQRYRLQHPHAPPAVSCWRSRSLSVKKPTCSKQHWPHPPASPPGSCWHPTLSSSCLHRSTHSQQLCCSTHKVLPAPTCTSTRLRLALFRSERTDSYSSCWCRSRASPSAVQGGAVQWQAVQGSSQKTCRCHL